MAAVATLHHAAQLIRNPVFVSRPGGRADLRHGGVKPHVCRPTLGALKEREVGDVILSFHKPVGNSRDSFHVKYRQGADDGLKVADVAQHSPPNRFLGVLSLGQHRPREGGPGGSGGSQEGLV